MSENAEYGLIMPFVIHQSNGSPHDDTSYVAGYEMGKIDAALKLNEALRIGPRPTIQTQIHNVNQPQAELLAMRYGHHAVFEELDGFPDWTTAEFMDQGAPMD